MSDGSSAVGQISDIATTWLESDGRPRMVVDQNLAVHWNNDAVHTLDPSIGFQVQSGRILFQCEGVSKDLKDLVASLSEHDSRSLPVTSSDGDAIYLIRGWPSNRRNLAMLEILCPAPLQSVSYDGLEKVLNLTPAEHRILKGVTSGKKIPEIAANHSLSQHTVRTHVRRIYAKAEVSSLFELMMKFRVFRFV